MDEFDLLEHCLAEAIATGIGDLGGLNQVELDVSIEDLSRDPGSLQDCTCLQQLTVGFGRLDHVAEGIILHTKSGVNDLDTFDSFKDAEDSLLHDEAIPGWRITCQEAVDSTQTVALEEWNNDPGRPVAARAVRQIAGRGRRGHQWESPEGGLWVSLVLPTTEPPDPFVGMAISLCALESVESLLPAVESRLALKWPNDLVRLSGRGLPQKWGGVITEVKRDRTGGAVLVIGVGLNLQVDPGRVQAANSTSILAEFGESPSPFGALSRILPRFDRWLADDRESGRKQSLDRVTRRLSTIGSDITWEESSARESTPLCREGRAVSLADDGALVVRLSTGDIEELRSADIRHVRPAST